MQAEAKTHDELLATDIKLTGDQQVITCRSISVPGEYQEKLKARQDMFRGGAKLCRYKQWCVHG